MSVPEKNSTFERWQQAIGRMSGKDRVGKTMPWVLLAFALVYYALYFRSGLNLGGEGGTAGVVAMRLMQGQRPIVDTFLGYNVLWFFPVVWIFEITGPNYLVLRGLFFAICILSAGLVYRVVLTYSKNVLFSAIPCLLAILIPGMLFRNYMPFLGILNAWLLTSAFVVTRASRKRTLVWALASGAGLGITFLFRIDLGIFFTAIFLGLGILHPFGAKKSFWKRSGFALSLVAVGLLMVCIVHIPFWMDAKNRGYETAFTGQYTGWIEMVTGEFRQFATGLQKEKATPPPPAAQQPATASPTPANTVNRQGETWEDRGARAKNRVSDIWKAPNWEERSLALCIYQPIPFALVVILTGCIFLLTAIVRKDETAKERALYPLTVLGCALALFPQYFFFRPDTVHIAEMMVPFLAALGTIVWAAIGYASRHRHPAQRAISVAAVAVCLAMASIYVSHALPKASAGTIFAKTKAAHRFDALNGVHVLVKEKEARWLAGLRDAVLNHSSPEEFVVCLPYSPTINFMTDRPSPLQNLYVDNATAGKHFMETFLKTMNSSHPAVVVLDQRKINNTEASRFRNWAPDVCRWLENNYVYFGRYDRNEVFVRSDKVSGPVKPEAMEVRD